MRRKTDLAVGVRVLQSSEAACLRGETGVMSAPEQDSRSVDISQAMANRHKCEKRAARCGTG